MSGKRIEDYALIGDGETAALVHRSGAIEWLCFPRFDSEACFAAILGDEQNGCWELCFGGERKRIRKYRDHSLILETEVVCEEGKARVVDFMPMRADHPRIVRIVECLEGSVTLESELRLRFDYGRIHPLVRSSGAGNAVVLSGPDAVFLDFDAPIEFTDRRFSSERKLRVGERAWFTLSWFPSHQNQPSPIDPVKALAQTEEFWRKWSGCIPSEGPYGPQIARSLVTLKALIYAPTGGMVAAPTSSLPEREQGSRNWDYRFCWLRDATFTVMVLTRWGLYEEARAWIEWLRRTIGGEPIDVLPFYAVDGDRRAIEWQSDWLSGFNGARPVRFGNGAEHQLQLDVYGEVIDALYQAAEMEVCDGEDSDALIRLIAARLEGLWDKPDAGIWESRGEPRHHTYSKVMCWVAFDRAAEWLADRDPPLSKHYRELANGIHAQVLERGVDETRNCFVQAYGDTALDGSALRIPLVGFLPADDPRVVATVAAIEQDLDCDGLFRRYNPVEIDDGIEEGEGAFIAVAFWMAEVYHMQGRTDDAQALFEHILESCQRPGIARRTARVRGRPAVGKFPAGPVAHCAARSGRPDQAGEGQFAPDRPCSKGARNR